MSSSREFEELYGVTEEQALNFWETNLQESMGAQRWSRICDSTGLYLATVLNGFCIRSVDRVELLSADHRPDEHGYRQFADLTQIAEMMARQLVAASYPLWMESAGAHILLYAGFFYRHSKERHNIEFFASLGRECYLMAAVGDRARTMKLVARRFDEHLFHLARLHQHLLEKKYLITVES